MSLAPLLGVNIDHVATIRQARHTPYPDPVAAMLEAEAGGADGITIHLREDRRHIQERDLRLVCELCQTRVNLEMAPTGDMLEMAARYRPQAVCLVPERRMELTTEGGLDVASQVDSLAPQVERLQSLGIEVSLFIDPCSEQVEAAKAAGAPVVELHTGAYADASGHGVTAELDRIRCATARAQAMGLKVNAGHGLHYRNVQPIAAIAQVHELNIGHAIVAEALFRGMREAVREMKRLLAEARR